MNPDSFRRAHPGLFFLDPRDTTGLHACLLRLDLVRPDEPLLAVGRAGDGNMNCTVRVRTARRSLVVKQARPWVEKYPQFPAPWDRSHRELEFYRLAAELPTVAALLPRLLASDPPSRLLVFEDLGDDGDYSDLYRDASFLPAEIDSLAAFLGALHAGSIAWNPPPSLPNREMRALNHAHIFSIPLRPDNGLDLDPVCPGLATHAHALRDDADFVAAVEQLGNQVYLADGPALLHGDFFPGSLVRSADGPRVIDPEFCFFGAPEIDVAVFAAHLLLARQPPPLLPRFLAAYRRARTFDPDLVARLAGVEIMRRLIGYAQLPLPAGLGFRRTLLQLAHELVLHPERSPWPSIPPLPTP